MKRISILKAITRYERTLTTIHPMEVEKRKVTLCRIAELRLFVRRLDHLAGYVEAFEHRNSIIIRQLIVRTLEVHWYYEHQATLTLIENATELENLYVSTFSVD